MNTTNLNLHQSKNDAPALYVGTYRKYANGSIAGAWLDLSTFVDAEEFIGYCRELHDDEHDPELMAQDFQGFPRALYCESMSYDTIKKIFDWMEYDDDERDMIAEYWDNVYADADPSDILDKCVYHGNFEDYADEVADEMIGNNDSLLARYFNHKAFARDLAMYYYITDNYVFACA